MRIAHNPLIDYVQKGKAYPTIVNGKCQLVEILLQFAEETVEWIDKIKEDNRQLVKRLIEELSEANERSPTSCGIFGI